MDSSLKSKKFGVVHTSPTELLTGGKTLELGKLYFAQGVANGAAKQGIYALTNSTDADGVAELTMFGCGALADGSGAGLMSSTDYTKLQGIAAGANKYSHPAVGTTDTACTASANADVTLNSNTTFTVVNGVYRDASGHVNKVATTKYTMPASAFTNTWRAIKVNGTEKITSSDSTALDISGGTNIDVSYNNKKVVISVKNVDASTADTADKVANSFKVRGDGTDIISFNGSSAKTINIVAGTNISLTKDAANGKLTINTTGVPTTTEMNTAINTALTSVLKYKGTVADSSALTTADKTKGSVYVASASFTTTTAQTGEAYTVEAGDYFISNGTTFDVVNGENQVSNANATLVWNTSTKIATVDGTNIYVKLPSNPNTDTKVTAVGNHYTPSADANSKITKTASSTTAATWGDTDMITGITLQRDAAGHVTDVSISSIQMPSNPNTDTKVTTVGNHYTPSADASKELKVDASSTTPATWGTTDLVTGVNIQRDAAGHVTGVTVDSIQMPSNPNSDTKVKDASTTNKSFILGHATQGTTAEAQTNSSCYMSGGYLYSGGSKVLTSVPDTTIYWETL